MARDLEAGLESGGPADGSGTLVPELVPLIREQLAELQRGPSLASMTRTGYCPESGRTTRASVLLLMWALAGLSADALGLAGAMWIVSVLTLMSGLVVAVRMNEILEADP